MTSVQILQLEGSCLPVFTSQGPHVLAHCQVGLEDTCAGFSISAHMWKENTHMPTGFHSGRSSTAVSAYGFSPTG